MIIDEALQRIQSLYSKGLQNRSTRLANRHIYNKLKTVRSKVISQQDGKKQIINQWSYQTLPLIELIEVPLNECPIIPQSGCMILRSKYPIPSFMTGLSRHLVQSVTGMEGRLIIQQTSYKNMKYNKGNRYTKNDPEWFLRNVYDDKNYMFITTTTRLECIATTALFDDPIQAWLFPMYGQANPFACLGYRQLEFPIDNDLMDSVVRISSDELIDEFTQGKQDKTNDAEDSTSRIIIQRGQGQDN